jgi:hypothetical protein
LAFCLAATHPLASNRAKGRPTHLQIPSFSTTGNRAEATSFRRAPPISRAQARTPHLTSSAGGEGGPPPSQEEEAAEWDNGRCADHKGEKWRCLLHIPPRGWWRGTVEAGARGFFFRAAASSSSSLPPATSGGGRGRRARPPPLRPPPPPPSLGTWSMNRPVGLPACCPRERYRLPVGKAISWPQVQRSTVEERRRKSCTLLLFSLAATRRAAATAQHAL